MAPHNQDVWRRLTRVFQDHFMDPEIVLEHETTAQDIDEWDSLNHIQLLVSIEQEFSLRFNTGEVAGLKNVGEMVEVIARKLDSP